jgi:hypothetical protein
MSMMRPGERPSFGIVICAGGSKVMPWGSTDHAGGRKKVPLGGAIGILSRCTWLIETRHSCPPPTQVTECAKTFMRTPGTPSISSTTSSSPPTSFAVLAILGSRIGPIGSRFSRPATVVIENSRSEKVSGRVVVVGSTRSVMPPTRTGLSTNWP